VTEGKHAESSIDGTYEAPGSQICKSSQALRISRQKSTVTSVYQSLLGTSYCRKMKIFTSTSDDEKMLMNSGYTQIRRNGTFFPTFTSRCIEVQFHNSNSWGFQALKTFQVIDEQDPIFAICYSGSSKVLENYSDDNCHRHSPFVVEGGGRGLLCVRITPSKKAWCVLG
jgi:hypothetical protein